MNAPRPLVAAIHAVLLTGFAGDSLAAVNTAGLVYNPITPCRIVDTRVTGQTFAAKETRVFFTNAPVAPQGGGNCMPYPTGSIPAALSVNVTVDATSLGTAGQIGFLNLTPVPGPGSSWMNFPGQSVIANAGVATINQADGTFAVKTQNPANVIIDVFGYFSQNPASQPPPGQLTPQQFVKGLIFACGQVTQSGTVCINPTLNGLRIAHLDDTTYSGLDSLCAAAKNTNSQTLTDGTAANGTYYTWVDPDWVLTTGNDLTVFQFSCH